MDSDLQLRLSCHDHHIMKSPIVLLMIYVMTTVPIEGCQWPRLCTSSASSAPTTEYPIINSAECNGSHLSVSWNRTTPSGCRINYLYLTYNCLSSDDEVLTETFLSDSAVTLVSRNLSVHMPSSPATECQISGLYIFSVEDCVELLQPTAINCSAEHHTPAHGHLEVITTSKRLQPVTTKFIDDQGNTFLPLNNSRARPSLEFIVATTVESVIVVFLVILIVILTIIKRKKSQVNTKEKSKSKNTYV